MTKKFQVLAVGNAIVDVLAPCSDAFLTENNIDKGVMSLIDTERTQAIYSKMSDMTQMSGGSAANTIAALAQLGVSTSLTALVKDDELGHVFANELGELGVDFSDKKVSADHADETARCMILVTPDGERSMNTYLGVSVQMTPDDVDPARVTDTDWVYLEGYLFDSEQNKAAFYKAVELAKGAGAKVALSLSDPFCVDRYRDAFKDLVADHVDLLFCNEHELASLYETDTAQDAFDHCKGPETVACTAGEKGAYILTNGTITSVSATSTNVVDATGAGDAFAAGYLYGVVNGKSDAECGKLGCTLAAEAISHMGARAQTDLNELVKSI